VLTGIVIISFQGTSNLVYLAVGALGPDLFYLLPDLSGTKGTVIRNVIKWAVDV